MPTRTDCIQTTDAMTSYADALKTQYQPTKDSSATTTKQFNKLPAHKTPRKYLFDPNDFPAITNKKQRNNDSSSTTSSITTEQTTNTTKTTATKQQESLAPPPPKFDLEELKNEIRNNIKEDLNRMITQQIEPLQQQIEPIREEVRSGHNDLSKCIDDLAASMKLLSAQMSQLSASIQSSRSPSPTTRGDGRT